MCSCYVIGMMCMMTVIMTNIHHYVICMINMMTAIMTSVFNSYWPDMSEWPRGPASRAWDCRWRALEAGPRATYSYQVNNLFIIPLCYVTILSASSARKCVNFFKKHIYMFYWLRKSYYWCDYLQLSCRNRSVKSVIGRRFLICLLCAYECHDVTAHDVLTTTSKMSVTAIDVMTTR